MFHFPSGKPITYKPSNKYTHNRKARQRLAIERQNYIESLYTRPILDLTIEELEQLLYSQ
jgi:IS5 family transposase